MDTPVQSSRPARPLRLGDEAIGGVDGSGGAARVLACSGTNMSRLLSAACIVYASNSLVIYEYSISKSDTEPDRSELSEDRTGELVSFKLIKIQATLRTPPKGYSVAQSLLPAVLTPFPALCTAVWLELLLLLGQSAIYDSGFFRRRLLSDHRTAKASHT